MKQEHEQFFGDVVKLQHSLIYIDVLRQQVDQRIHLWVQHLINCAPMLYGYPHRE